MSRIAGTEFKYMFSLMFSCYISAFFSKIKFFVQVIHNIYKGHILALVVLSFLLSSYADKSLEFFYFHSFVNLE